VKVQSPELQQRVCRLWPQAGTLCLAAQQLTSMSHHASDGHLSAIPRSGISQQLPGVCPVHNVYLLVQGI
jgi:hypothetical protein